MCQSNCQSQSDNCYAICSNQGNCDEVTDTCICHDGTGYNADGFWGDLCEELSCPGMNEPCSGHGQCIQGSCNCDLGWRINETSCHVADCPGSPDCNGNGVCETTAAVPYCECFSGYMGIECENQCVHGTVQEDYTCLCDSCYTGAACDEACSGHGECENNTCICHTAYWGR